MEKKFKHMSRKERKKAERRQKPKYLIPSKDYDYLTHVGSFKSPQTSIETYIASIYASQPHIDLEEAKNLPDIAPENDKSGNVEYKQELSGFRIWPGGLHKKEKRKTQMLWRIN
jgi:hypothetical protein